MYSISLNLSSDEWQRIKRHADKQWPHESLSVSEILRRYILIGIDRVKNIPPQGCATISVRASSIDASRRHAAEELGARSGTIPKSNEIQK